MKKTLLMLSAMVGFCFISAGCGEQKTEAIKPEKVVEAGEFDSDSEDNSAEAPAPPAP